MPVKFASRKRDCCNIFLILPWYIQTLSSLQLPAETLHFPIVTEHLDQYYHIKQYVSTNLLSAALMFLEWDLSGAKRTASIPEMAQIPIERITMYTEEAEKVLLPHSLS